MNSDLDAIKCLKVLVWNINKQMLRQVAQK